MRRINKTYLNLQSSLESEDLRTEEERRAAAEPVVEPVLEPAVEPTESSTTPEVVVDANAPAEEPTEVVTPEVVVTTAVAEVPAVPAAATDSVVTEPAREPVADEVVPAAETPAEEPAPVEEVIEATEPVAAEPVEALVETPVEEPATEPVVEPVAEEPVAQPVEERPVAEEPVAEVPAIEPTVEPAVEPAAAEPEVQAVEPAPGTTAEAVQGAASAAANALANADLPADSKVVVIVVEPVVSEAEQNELADAGELIEAEVDDSERAAMEAEEVIAEIEIVSDASTVLTQLADVVEEQAENGGLSDDAARILTIATEGIYSQLNLKGHNGIPSLESFQGKYTRVGATTFSLEDINSKLKSFGNALVEGAKKILEFITKFFASVFTATGRLEARAKKIKSLAAGFKGNGSASLELPALFNKLVVGNAVPSNFAAGMSAINDFVQEATSGVHSEGVTKLAEMTKKARDQGKWFVGVVDEDMEKFTSMVFGEAHKVVTEALTLRSLSAVNSQRAIDFGAPESSEGTVLKASAIFPGNTIIWAHVPKTADSIDEMRIGRASYGEKVAAKAIPNLSGSEISKIADQALRFVELKRQFDNAFSEAKAAMQLVSNIASFNASFNAVNKSINEEEGFRAFGTFFRKMFRVTSALANGVHRYALADALRVHNAALDYAQAALSSATKEGKVQAKLAKA